MEEQTAYYNVSYAITEASINAGNALRGILFWRWDAVDNTVSPFEADLKSNELASTLDLCACASCPCSPLPVQPASKRILRPMNWPAHWTFVPVHLGLVLHCLLHAGQASCRHWCDMLPLRAMQTLQGATRTVTDKALMTYAGHPDLLRSGGHPVHHQRRVHSHHPSV